MNKTFNSILIVIAVLALAGGLFFAGSMYAHLNAYGQGMMGNGRGGYGMMGGNGMMRGFSWKKGTNPDVTPLTVDQARGAAEKFIQSINIQGLAIGEVMIFDNNSYVLVKESETGRGAFELLVDPSSQVAYPEYGPNMMWNLKYGGLHHAGMMGGNGMMNRFDGNNSTPANGSYDMVITSEQAVRYAQQYLDANFAGATAATDPTQFYGYYTLDYEVNGRVAGC